MGPGSLQELPPMMMMGSPIDMEADFGFGPWEDLHRNLERRVQRTAQQGALVEQPARHAVGPVVQELGPAIGNLLELFGNDHSGHFGRSEGGFEVDNDAEHHRFRITALLPGYQLDDGKEGEAPLSVRVVGRRTLVVSGTKHMGKPGHGPTITSTWQRSFSLPKGADSSKVEVTYKAADGNLTVAVPLGNVTVGEDDEDEDDGDGLEGLPPALQAMRQGLPAILQQLAGGGRPRRGGFMLPMASTGDLLSDVFGQVGALHPRFHGPAVGGRPVPEDVDVNLVGCFAESQFAEAELKYYGSQNGASFGPMFWHARDDGVPYFAMARHDEPLGHGFTFRTFAHDKEQPKWGVYDGCGAPCNDDEARYCGCAGEGNRGFGSSECDEGEKRFAVYRIAPNRTLAPEVPSLSNASNASGAANATSALAAASAQHSRPHWRLS